MFQYIATLGMQAKQIVYIFSSYSLVKLYTNIPNISNMFCNCHVFEKDVSFFRNTLQIPF